MTAVGTGLLIAIIGLGGRYERKVTQNMENAIPFGGDHFSGYRREGAGDVACVILVPVIDRRLHYQTGVPGVLLPLTISTLVR